MKKAFPQILILLSTLFNEQSDRSSEAVGLLHQINFECVFNICMYTKILSLCKGVSDYLQQVTSDIGHANSLVCSLIDTFKTMREEDFSEFSSIYAETEKICQENNIDLASNEEIRKKSRRKIPNKFENNIVDQTIQDI